MGQRGSTLEGLGLAVVDKSWADRAVLVTGATGMIGSWLVKELLGLGAHVVTLVRDSDPSSELYRSGDIQRVSVVNGSLEEFWTLHRAVGEHQVETVFHLGAQAIVGTANRFPLPTFETNIRGTYNLLEACRLHSDSVKSVVIASSDKAYGEQTELPYTEDSPLAAIHPYDVSKACADLIAQSYFRTYDMPVGIVRCGNVYGGCDLNWSRIVPGTIRSLIQGRRPIIRSDGTYLRDYIYVKDVVQAYVKLADALPANDVMGEAFNFGNESPVSVLELVRQIQELMGCTGLQPEILATAKSEIHSQYLSASKAQQSLGWRPEYDFQRGLRETIEWYRGFLAL